MRHYLIILLSLCAIVLFSGCQSQALRALIEPQEWTNYAITEGVTCTDPAMIDGDAKTRGYADGRWIHITLPTRKPIHRIVIRGTNIRDAMLYQKLQGNGRWRAILQVQNNRGPAIEMRTSVVTEALRVYISGTADDKQGARRFSERHNAMVRPIQLGRAYAHEIEVYGFVSKEVQP